VARTIAAQIPTPQQEAPDMADRKVFEASILSLATALVMRRGDEPARRALFVGALRDVLARLGRVPAHDPLRDVLVSARDYVDAHDRAPGRMMSEEWALQLALARFWEQRACAHVDRVRGGDHAR
jgi:hypothetical protein